MKKTVSYVSMLLVAAAVLSAGCTGSRSSRSTGEYIDDKGINARVKSSLFADPNVSGFQVNVDTFDRVVSLSGFVDTAAQKSRAEELARTTPGVRQVRNNLIVRQAVRDQQQNNNPQTTSPQ